MHPETVTRLRNAFAQAALDWLDAPVSAATSAASPLPFSSMTAEHWRAAIRLWRGHAEALLAGTPTRGCPACGGEASRFLFVSYDAHPFHECDQCGCWFVPKVIDAALFERLFDRAPEARDLAARMMAARDGDEGRDADMARVGSYLDELLPLVPADGERAYLDTGCGVGHSLRAGRERGLRAQGVEADPTAVGIARAAGLPVVTPDQPVPPGPYHLLSFWETLEHVAAPLEALGRYLPHLHEHGLVAITVPNLNALATRVLRESCAWVHGGYNTPGHINLFSLSSMTRLLERAGLTVLDADGQFSANPLELTAFLAGQSRGAFDQAWGAPAGTLPTTVADALIDVWPGAALLERLGLGSPILQVVACRTGAEPRFAAAIAERRRARGRAISDLARQLIAAEPDYKGMTEALQGEVNKRDALLQGMQGEITRRDELLRTTVHGLQQEIDRRDRRLADTVTAMQAQLAERDHLRRTATESQQQEIDRRDALLRATTDTMQQEINRRDELLHSTTAAMQQAIDTRDEQLRAARDRFDRSISGRLLAVRHAIGRLLRGRGRS